MLGNLVLTRKLNEVVRIGEDVEVQVTHIGGGDVRLRITAPKETRVLRKEVWLRIHDTGRACGTQSEVGDGASAKVA